MDQGSSSSCSTEVLSHREGRKMRDPGNEVDDG